MLSATQNTISARMLLYGHYKGNLVCRSPAAVIPEVA